MIRRIFFVVGVGGSGAARLPCSLAQTRGLEEECLREQHALSVECTPPYLELVIGSVGPKQGLHFYEK